jgi:hypothetical protein
VVRRGLDAERFQIRHGGKRFGKAAHGSTQQEDERGKAGEPDC